MDKIMSWYRIKRKFKHKPKALQYQFVEEPDAKKPDEQTEPAQEAPESTKIKPDVILPSTEPQPLPQAPAQAETPKPVGTSSPTEEGMKKLNFIRKQKEAVDLRNNLLNILHADPSKLQDVNQQIELWNQSNPDIVIPQIMPEDSAIVDFRKSLVAQTKELIDAKIPNENASQNQTKNAYADIIKILKSANLQIDNFNQSNPSTLVKFIDWKEFPELVAPQSGVMGYFLMPYSGQGQGQKDVEGKEHIDTNTTFIVEKIKSVFADYGITDDKAGAELLAILASSDDHPDVRLLVNEYFAAKGRKNLHQIIHLAGFENLAKEFEKIPAKDLNYKKPYDMEKLDEVFGEDYGLSTRSEAERQILSIFRGLDLQPIPVEIKMPSTKVRKDNKEVNTEFMCDFLLPCSVLQWSTDESGKTIPKIKDQMMFVGEYLGFYSLKPKTDKVDSEQTKDDAKRNKIIEDYAAKTAVKTELQPFQTFLVGGDVIHISKDDFESGGNAFKLIYQLEQKNIIFKGSKATQDLEKWKTDPNGGLSSSPELLSQIDLSLQKMTPEMSIVKSAMMQLQFKFGEVAKFFKNYSDPENEDYRNLVQSYYKQYTAARQDSEGNILPSLQQEQFQLNQQIRALTYRVSSDIQKEAKEEFEKAKEKIKGKISDIDLKRIETQSKQRVYARYYNWQKIADSKFGEKFIELMDKLQDINSQIRNIYAGHSSDDPNALTASSIREKHLQALENSTDDQGYQPRLQELKTLESCLEQPTQPMCSFMPTNPKEIPAFVAKVCNNALSGLKVTLTRETKKQSDVFNPMLPKMAVAFNKYKKLINGCNLDIFFK